MRASLRMVVCALTIALQASTAFAADNAVARSKDASDFFLGACLRTLGYDKAVSAVMKPMLDAKAAVALRDVARAGEPRATGGYEVATPSGARLTLLTGPKRFCSMIVDASDAASMRSNMQAALKKAASGLKGTLSTSPAATKEEAGAKVTVETYKIILPNKGTAAPTVIVSTADKAVNGKQHLVTFYIGKKPAAK